LTHLFLTITDENLETPQQINKRQIVKESKKEQNIGKRKRKKSKQKIRDLKKQ
jgi:hypothetical protein